MVKNLHEPMLVDPEDSWVYDLKLRFDGRYVKHRDSYLHRKILEKSLGRKLSSTEIVDHINGIKWDNRKSNLRIVDKSTNAMNCKTTTRNLSGYKGVSKSRKKNKWEARIMKDYEIVWREHFDTPEEAHEAYKAKRNELFGDQWAD